MDRLSFAPGPGAPTEQDQEGRGSPASDERQSRLPSPPALGSHTESCSRIKAGRGAFVPSYGVLCPLVLALASTFYFTRGYKGTDQRPLTSRVGILSAGARGAARGPGGRR